MHHVKKFLPILVITMAFSPVLAESTYDVDLIKSVRTGESSSVRYYLDQGADVNICVGEKRKTPLMFAIDELARDLAQCTPITVGLEEIIGGAVYTAGGALGLFLLSDIFLNKEFHKDVTTVWQGKDKTLSNQVDGLWRSVRNSAQDLLQSSQNPSSITNEDGEVQLHKLRPPYRVACEQLPNIKGRVAAMIAAGVVAAGITTYGIYNFARGLDKAFIKSIQDAWRIYHRKQIINVLLQHPHIDLNVINNNNQRALDLVRNHMVDAHNHYVTDAMKQIETRLLEKMGLIAK